MMSYAMFDNMVRIIRMLHVLSNTMYHKSTLASLACSPGQYVVNITTGLACAGKHALFTVWEF